MGSQTRYCCVILFIENFAFQHTIKMASIREQTMGSALARFYDCSLHFNNTPNKLHYWDYTLFSIENGWLKTMEQQEDNYAKSEDDNLCFEVLTHLDQENTKQGKLNYTKAKRFVYVLNNLSLVLLLSVERVRQLCVNYEDAGILQTTTPKDFQKWRKEKDTLPTTCCLLPMQEVLLNDPKAKALSFNEIGITNNYQTLK
jgi:hypothetical protein